jgi:hypothetical protein
VYSVDAAKIHKSMVSLVGRLVTRDS